MGLLIVPLSLQIAYCLQPLHFATTKHGKNTPMNIIMGISKVNNIFRINCSMITDEI